MAIYAKFQHTCKKQLLDKQNIAERMQNTAKNCNIGFGHSVWALIAIIGDSIKDIIFDVEEEQYEIDWDDIKLPTEEEYHDASVSLLGTWRSWQQSLSVCNKVDSTYQQSSEDFHCNEIEWFKDIRCANMPYNDKCSTKPKIAILHFEDKSWPLLFDLKDEISPYDYLDQDDRVIDKNEAYYDCTTSKAHYDDQWYREVMTRDDVEQEIPTNSYINALKNFGVLNYKRWKPSLNSIKEERITEVQLLKWYNHDGCKFTYNKKLKDRVKKLDAKINTTIGQTNGLNQVQVDTNNKLQNDSGANQSVTGSKHLLLRYKFIQLYPMGGVNNSETVIVCTDIGYLPWQSEDGEITMIKTYFSSDVHGTIISPTDIVMTHKERFNGWDMTIDCDEGLGEFCLRACDGVSH